MWATFIRWIFENEPNVKSASKTNVTGPPFDAIRYRFESECG